MAESLFVGRLVDDHSVFHVVSGVGKDSNNCVGARVVVGKLEALIKLGADQWFLAVQDAVELIVEPVVPVEHTGSHGLLGHLALVHVSRGLVVVEEGDVLGEDGEKVGGRVL